MRRRLGEAKHYPEPLSSVQTMWHELQALAADKTHLNLTCLYQVTQAIASPHLTGITFPPCLYRSLSGRLTVRRTWRRQ